MIQCAYLKEFFDNVSERKDIMLTHLHVKNLAIVEDVQVDFDDGLNILTGETGVGKSIIIGAVNTALGAKVSSDMIRSGAEYALVEMVFEPDDETWNTLKRFDVFPEGNGLIISRKIMNNRSSCRVNGETVTIALLKNLAGFLLDMHGQHEHQSLMNNEKHLEILDRYAGSETGRLKEKAAELYGRYSNFKKEYDSMSFSEEERKREISFIEYEMSEIEAAAVKTDEEEELDLQYKRLSNAGRIAETLDYVYGLTGNGDSCASDMIGSGLARLHEVSEYDSSLKDYAAILTDVENILSDFNHDIASYMSEYTFDEQLLKETEERLDFIRKIFAKYGGSADSVNEYYNEISRKLNDLNLYEEHREKLGIYLEDSRLELIKCYDHLTKTRSVAALELKVLIRDSLLELNFLNVQFDIKITELDTYTPNGVDGAEFMISTNPGEPLRPLAKVASGGELSRVMLAIKSVLADSDSIHTLVFDEIDTGISGRTAQKVSEKLAHISANHQVICITHLAQIAAMADNHYAIEKNINNGRTKTDIRLLDASESDNEIARILGGTVITESVITNAREMKQLANEWKSAH